MASKLRRVPEQRDDLIVQKVGDETIVYDLASHRAHSLNRTAALVFEKLDGKHDLTSVARHVGKALGRSPQKGIVDAAVNELAAADLLQPGAALPRRSVLRGLAVGLLPVVVSIAVPPAAQAQSCVPEFSPCVNGVDVCCGGSCYQCFDTSGVGAGPWECQNRC
jgi:hypothetical protein